MLEGVHCSTGFSLTLLVGFVSILVAIATATSPLFGFDGSDSGPLFLFLAILFLASVIMVCVTVTALIAFPAPVIAASVARVFATCVVMNIARLAAALAITLAAFVACPATFVAFPTWSVVDLPRVLSCVE